MVQLIRHLAQSRKRQELGRIWVQVISYAITNPEFGRALQRHSFAPRRAQIQKILDRAIAKKQLRKEVDIEIALDLLIGPMMRRRFLDETVPDGWAELVVGYFWQIFSKAVGTRGFSRVSPRTPCSTG
jgi:hypothetical protein